MDVSGFEAVLLWEKFTALGQALAGNSYLFDSYAALLRHKKCSVKTQRAGARRLVTDCPVTVIRFQWKPTRACPKGRMSPSAGSPMGSVFGKSS